MSREENSGSKPSSCDPSREYSSMLPNNCQPDELAKIVGRTGFFSALQSTGVKTPAESVGEIDYKAIVPGVDGERGYLDF